MRIRSIGATSVALGLWLLPLSNRAWAIVPGGFDQPPDQPGPYTDTTQSLGQFSIVINPAFAPAFVGVPGYDASKNIFTSPLLYDPTTTIDRSATTTVGSAAYNAGLTVGSPSNGTVSPSSITAYPTGFTPVAGEDTVFTQIHSFNLSGSGFSVTAGAAALPGTPASVGEVTSNATGSNIGNPANDFPAKSFFDIFVDVTVPLPPSLGGGTATLDNPSNAPLIVENPAITTLPPVVIYTHGNSSAVVLQFLGGPDAGDTLGLITLAGHGAGYGQNGSSTGTGTDENTGQPADATDFETDYMQEYNNPSDLMPLPDVIDPTSGTNEETWSSYVPDVPEPSSLSLLAVGVVAAGLRNRSRRRASEMPAV